MTTRSNAKPAAKTAAKTATTPKPVVKKATTPKVAVAPAAPNAATAPPAPATVDVPLVGGKLGMLIGLMQRPDGADIHEMAAATGWQVHSVRGALAGALKARGFTITSEKTDQRRIYRAFSPAKKTKARSPK